MDDNLLTHDELVEQLAQMFREMDGDDFQDVWNQMRGDKIRYLEDSLYERVEKEPV